MVRRSAVADTRQECEIDIIVGFKWLPIFQGLFHCDVPACGGGDRMVPRRDGIGTGMAVSAGINSGNGLHAGAGKADGVGTFLHQFKAAAGRGGFEGHHRRRSGDADEVAERFTGR